MTLIEIEGDVVADTGGNNGRNIHFVGNGTSGSSTAYHSMDYYRQVVDSVDNIGWQAILNESGNQKVFIGGRLLSGTQDFVVDGYRSGNNNLVIYDNGHDTLTDPLNNDWDIFYGGRGDDDLTGGGASEVLLGGAGNDDLYGNGDVDTLDGGSGSDFLWGGAGNDMLTGGSEADIFYFFQPSDGRDAIADFQSGTDKIWVKSSNFASMSQGLLTDASFFSGSNPSAINGNAAFLYNVITGVLTFDSNGSSFGGRTDIAALVNMPPNFRASDIQVVG